MSRSISRTNASDKNNPIYCFCKTISRLPNEEWQAKTSALKQLTGLIAEAANVIEDDDDMSIASQESTRSYSSRYRDKKKLSPPLHPRPPQHPRSPQYGGGGGGAPSFWPDGSPPVTEEILEPNMLRRLCVPFRTLLSDLRTLVVKSACYNLAKIAKMTGDNSRLLLTELFPDILNLHAQTVKVMHGYAMQAMLVIIQFCKFKAAVAILLKEGAGNKRKDVRGACTRYLRQIIDSWPSSYLGSEIEPIGHGLAKSIVDPCQAVRMEARQAFLQSYYRRYPETWCKIVHAPTGIFAQDARLKKSILTQSVAMSGPSKVYPEKKASEPDHSRKEIVASKEETPPPPQHSINPFHDLSKTNRKVINEELRNKAAVSIQAAARGASTRKSLLQKPTRLTPFKEVEKNLEHVNNDVSQSTNSYRSPQNYKMSSRLGTTAGRMVALRKSISTRSNLPEPPSPQSAYVSPLKPSPIKDSLNLRLDNRLAASPKRNTHIEKTTTCTDRYLYSHQSPSKSFPVRTSGAKSPTPVTRRSWLDKKGSTSFDTIGTSRYNYEHVSETTTSAYNSRIKNYTAETLETFEESAFDNSMLVTPHPAQARLKPAQKKRDSSMLLQQRLKDQQNEDQECVAISKEIFTAHKKHMNKLMLTLRQEMDLIADFELLLQVDSNNNNERRNKTKLSEQKILEYYEGIVNCLDKRKEMAEELQQQMERICNERQI